MSENEPSRPKGGGPLDQCQQVGHDHDVASARVSNLPQPRHVITFIAFVAIIGGGRIELVPPAQVRRAYDDLPLQPPQSPEVAGYGVHMICCNHDDHALPPRVFAVVAFPGWMIKSGTPATLHPVKDRRKRSRNDRQQQQKVAFVD